MSIYTIEALLKLIFYGTYYFNEGWNTFDFGIVFFGIILTFLTNILPNNVTIPMIILSWVRIAKLLSLFKMTNILRKMFQTFVLALPAIANLALLFIIVESLFAVVGVYLFAEIKLQTDFNFHANFQTFYKAFTTVFRLGSGDNWNYIMHDVMRERTQYFSCIDFPTYEDIVNNGGVPNGCGHIYYLIYFVLLILTVFFMFLNLFVAVVINSMQEITKLSESVLSDERLEKFQNIWKKYDPEVICFCLFLILGKRFYGIHKRKGVDERNRKTFRSI